MSGAESHAADADATELRSSGRACEMDTCQRSRSATCAFSTSSRMATRSREVPHVVVWNAPPQPSARARSFPVPIGSTATGGVYDPSVRQPPRPAVELRSERTHATVPSHWECCAHCLQAAAGLSHTQQ